VKLFSAMMHEQAVVIAQIRIPDGTTEVTQVAALLDPVDLAGAVITADACRASTTMRQFNARRPAASLRPV
jgi:hypothetical protein